MTIEVFDPAPIYTIQGTGPYTIPHPYGEGAIRARVITASQVVDLSEVDFSVAPDSSDTEGDVTLSGAIATQYAGLRLLIERETLDEQGWVGVLGERERGLEEQLDQITMAVQELRRQVGMTFRSVQPIRLVAPQEGRVLMFSGDSVVPGPNAEEIASAGENATVAAEAREAAEAARDELVGAADEIAATVPSLAYLLASPRAYPANAIVYTRKEGYSFQVVGVGDDPDMASAGAFFRVLPDPDGFVHLEQYGAVPDGNRYTGAGTDNTLAIRRAMATRHNIKIGRGTFVVRNTIQNLVENRQIVGSGAGMVNSAPIGDRLYFNAPSCILAVGDAATKRVITRRRYRASAADPNDTPIAAVIENWGAGSTYSNFSIELFCDYSDASPGNMGADWDVGFFNGCRSNVGLDHVSVLGYFRKASSYWDVTDAYGIPNVLDIYGVPVPFPTAGDDDGPEYGRGSGADGCWMQRCEIRGRLCRVLFGPDAGRTGAPYYDWVTDATYDDFRGGSGASDFRSRDCSLRAEHHSNYRMADPIGYGSPLTYANMMMEDDFAPGVQHIDSGNTNSADVAGPAPAARGIELDDLRYVSREIFRTRLGQVKELFLGTRTWSETPGMPDELYDTAGNDIYAVRGDETTHVYGHLCTNEYTGLVRWENTVSSIFTRWVYDWRWTTLTDRQGRRRGPDEGFIDAPAGANVEIHVGQLRPGGHISISTGGIGNNTPLSQASAFLLFDVGSTPSLASVGSLGSNFQIIATNTVPTNGNVTDGNLGVSAMGDGRLIFRNRLAAGDTVIAWRVL